MTSLTPAGSRVRHPAVALLLVTTLSSVTGCGRILPAPETPQAGNAPKIELPDAQPGESVVVIDTNEPARVGLVLGHTSAVAYGSRGGSAVVYGSEVKQICSHTPCAVSLPQREHELVFQGVEDTDAQAMGVLDVKRRPVAMRVAMGEVKVYPGAYYGGLTLATTGLVLGSLGALIAGGTTYDYESNSQVSNKFLGMSQGSSIAVGGLLLAGGIALAYIFQPTLKPGSQVTFDLSPISK